MPSTQEPTSSALQALAEGKAAGTWTLDPERSQVLLETRHTWGLLPLHGAFTQVSGTGTVSAAGDVTGTVTVPAASVETKNKQRDTHLRSKDFFDVENHPDFTYTVEAVKPAGDGVTVEGQLTVRGRTQPAPFDVVVSGFTDGEVQLDGQLPVNRADFGMTWNMLGIAALNSVIVVHAVFTREQ
jgi:polyisoprenoid-binding protein YceI